MKDNNKSRLISLGRVKGLNTLVMGMYIEDSIRKIDPRDSGVICGKMETNILDNLFVD